MERELFASDDWLGANNMTKPVWRTNAGHVSAAVWENSITANGKQVTVLKCSVQRRYKDKDGQWKSSMSFNRNEIFLAMWCLRKALDYIIESQQNDENSSVEEEMVM
jgi:hypothetical protein